MAVGKYRFLYDNVLTNATITADNIKEGHLENAVKHGVGSARLTTLGTFTGSDDIQFTVTIDSVIGGFEIGQATFSWNQDGVTQASGVATSGTITLSNGVEISFTGGTGNDFEENDSWNFYGINEFSPSNLSDLDRDTRYQSDPNSATPTSTIHTFDMGSALAFDSIAILDHNLSNTATITLEANATDVWTSPTFTQVITWNSDKIIQYFTSQSFAFARLVIVDASNTDGFIDMSIVFLAEYLELTRAMPLSFAEPLQLLIGREETTDGVMRRQYRGSRRKIDFTSTLLTGADEDAIIDMQESITNLNDRTILPVMFHKDSENPEEFWIVEFNDISIQITDGNLGGTVYHSVAFNLTEIVRSIA